MPGRVPIIFDTDMSIDVDDVGALCVAHALADRGEAEILATTHNTGLPEGVGAISVINYFYGRGHIPIGAYRGRIGRPSETPAPDWTNHGAGWYVKALVDNFPHPISEASQVEDATTILRRALAGSPGGRSVTVVAVGHATNLRDLLHSQPDSISPLQGVELVRQKVKQLVFMGGSFWVKDRVEWNFGGCGGPSVVNTSQCGAYTDLAQATADVLHEWPHTVPTTFVSFDIGFSVRAGGVLKSGATEQSPCRQAYMEFCGGTGGSGGLPDWCDAKGRNAWDLMAVVLGVRGVGSHIHLMPGTNTMDAQTGRNSWEDDPRGPSARPNFDYGHFQAWMKDASMDDGAAYAATGNEIDELLLRLPTAAMLPLPLPPPPDIIPPPPKGPPPPPSPHVPPPSAAPFSPPTMLPPQRDSSNAALDVQSRSASARSAAHSQSGLGTTALVAFLGIAVVLIWRRRPRSQYTRPGRDSGRTRVSTCDGGNVATSRGAKTKSKRAKGKMNQREEGEAQPSSPSSIERENGADSLLRCTAR
jgi:hypothetical protein